MSDIAVVMPTYNAQRYIAEAIDSILAQSVADFTLYIVDGGSRDLTGDIARAYQKEDPRVRFVFRPGSKPAERFNMMMEELQESIIIVAHADDYNLPDRLQTQCGYLTANPDCIVCGSSVNFWQHDRHRTALNNYTGTLTFPATHDEIVSRLPFWWCFCTPSIAINRKLFTEGRLQFDTELEAGADWLFYWQAAKVGRLHNLSEVLVWWRHHHMSDGATHINEISDETYLIRKVIADELRLLERLTLKQRAAYYAMRVEYDLIITAEPDFDYVALFSRLADHNDTLSALPRDAFRAALASLRKSPITSLLYHPPIIELNGVYSVHTQAEAASNSELQAKLMEMHSALMISESIIADLTQSISKAATLPSLSSSELMRLKKISKKRRSLFSQRIVWAARASKAYRCPGFDEAYYRETNQDLSWEKMTPLEHFMTVGWREGREPSAAFNMAGYLKANPDVAEASINPLLHFLEHGRAEQRRGW